MDNAEIGADNAQQIRRVRQRVAVVVLVDAEGNTAGDAHTVAEIAVARAVTAADLTVTVPDGAVRPVEVLDVTTVNAALRTGLLQLVPTHREGA